MKLHLIVLGLLVIGWVSARPMMTESSPVENPGKNNTVTDHNTEQSTDTKPGDNKESKVLKSKREYRYPDSGRIGGNVEDEMRANGGTQPTVAFQDHATNKSDSSVDNGKNDSENESQRNGQSDDGGNSANGKQRKQINGTEEQNNQKNRDTEGSPYEQISGNKRNVDEQQGSNNTQNETKVQNEAPTKTLNAADKENNVNGTLLASHYSSPNVLQYPSNNANPSVLAGNLNDTNKPNGVRDNGYLSATGSQNVNPSSMSILDNSKQQPAISAQGSNIIGTPRPGGSQGTGIKSLDGPDTADGNAGINFNQAASSAQSLNQGNLSENGGNTPPNFIVPQRPIHPSTGQGISGGQVLPPLATSFISTRPREGQSQESSDGITNNFQTNSNGGGAVPLNETHQGSTGNNVYYSPTDVNGGSTRPFKETNQGTSSNTIHYNPLYASNVSSTKLSEEILQGSVNNFAVIPPSGNVGDNKIPFQQVYQGTSASGISSVPQQVNYANAGPVQDTNQGIARPGTFTNLGNGVSLFGGGGSGSDFQSQNLYGSDSSYKPTSLNPSSSLNLNDFKVGPQSGSYNLKDPTNGNPIRGTPFKDSTNNAVRIPDFASIQNNNFGVNYAQRQDQFATPQGTPIISYPYPSGGGYTAQGNPYKDPLGSGGSVPSFEKHRYDAFGNYIGVHRKVFEDDGYQFGADGSPVDGEWVFTEHVN